MTTIQIVKCGDSTPISYASVCDNYGNCGYTQSNGYIIDYEDIPGSVLSISANGFVSTTHVLTGAEVNNAFAQICLNAAPPPPPNSCFTSETAVLMADGSERPICQIRIGGLVLGRDGRANRVVGIETPLLGNRLLYALNDSAAFVTAEHPIWCDGAWKAIDPTATAQETRHLTVQPLRVGDRVSVLQGVAVPAGAADKEQPVLEPVVLSDIREISADPHTPLYNLLLSGDHTYFANEFLVHNKGIYG